jgi:DNA mismatch repair protein MSH5
MSLVTTQVALITFLAHVGSFVPATSARIGLTDRIFTRVASREAAAVPKSTFMIDLSQIAAMLRLSTERWVGLVRYWVAWVAGWLGAWLLSSLALHCSEPAAPTLS